MEDEEIDWLLTVGKLILFQREYDRYMKYFQEQLDTQDEVL